MNKRFQVACNFSSFRASASTLMDAVEIAKTVVVPHRDPLELVSIFDSLAQHGETIIYTADGLPLQVRE